MKSKEIKIKYKGVELTVDGIYKIGGGYYNRDTPPEVDEFDINSVVICGGFCSILLDESEIEKECISKCKE